MTEPVTTAAEPPEVRGISLAGVGAPAPVSPRARRTGKLESVVSDCVYQIATGVWTPGTRLPPLREAKQRWGINEVTCFRVYRRLVERGLVVSRDRDGYYVAPGESVGRLHAMNKEFQGLWEWFERGAPAHTGMSLVGAARALAQMAEARSELRPECAFVECTEFQAGEHAAEVRHHLGVACRAITTGQLRAAGVPDGVRTIVTTPWHTREARDAAKQSGVAVLTAPVELAPAMIQSIRGGRGRGPGRGRRWTVFALTPALAASMAEDLRARVGGGSALFPHRAVSTARLEACLGDELGGARPAKACGVLLSPSLWSVAPEVWRARVDVRPVQYRVVPSAWETIAAALGLPVSLPAEPGDERPALAHP